jgi:hypothetical protein
MDADAANASSSAFFKAPLRFGAETTSVGFDPSWLTQRPDIAHLAFPDIARCHYRRPEARCLDPGAARRAVIACMAQGIVGVDSVASFVGLSKRTLNRRLAERGTSTKDAEVRIQIAQQLMLDTTSRSPT